MLIWNIIPSMSTQERPRSLTYQIRQQVALNRTNGDQKSYIGGGWKPYGSDISSYDATFRLALGTSIASFINDRKAPVVVDLMAPSFTLLSLFAIVSDKNNFGLAVSLSDERTRVQKWRDKGLNVIQLAGDIMSSATWRNIDEVMQGRKADLIMERALGGLDIIPPQPKLYAILINKAWKILSDKEGVMLLHTPHDSSLLAAGIHIQDFVNNLKANGINAECFKSGVPISLVTPASSVLKLIKTPDSPKNLPFLK